MLDLKRKYVVDEKNRRIAVQIDIETFEKIEEALENYGLARIMEVSEQDEALNLADAESYYKTLEKAD
jgi:RelB Antitoxin alpha helical domain